MSSSTYSAIESAGPYRLFDDGRIRNSTGRFVSSNDYRQAVADFGRVQLSAVNPANPFLSQIVGNHTTPKETRNLSEPSAPPRVSNEQFQPSAILALDADNPFCHGVGRVEPVAIDFFEPFDEGPPVEIDDIFKTAVGTPAYPKNDLHELALLPKRTSIIDRIGSAAVRGQEWLAQRAQARHEQSTEPLNRSKAVMVAAGALVLTAAAIYISRRYLADLMPGSGTNRDDTLAQIAPPKRPNGHEVTEAIPQSIPDPATLPLLSEPTILHADWFADGFPGITDAVPGADTALNVEFGNGLTQEIRQFAASRGRAITSEQSYDIYRRLIGKLGAEHVFAEPHAVVPRRVQGVYEWHIREQGLHHWTAQAQTLLEEEISK